MSEELIHRKAHRTKNRRYFIGGSDARIIMGDDETSLIRLWREKRGEVEPVDLSSNLIVQLGLATEDLNRRWYQTNTGQVLTDVQRQIRHPVLRWMAATLDGRVAATEAVFEAKFMLPWSFSEEAATEKYMPQLQHNMWVLAARSAVLSVITGGGKWVEITTHADPLYQHLIVTAERKFWRCVESGEPPRLFGVEPPRPRIEAVRIVDMSASNSWAEFAGLFRKTRQAFLEHERSKAELKALMPEDAKEAIGHGIRARRSKSGAVSFDLLEVGPTMQRSSQSIASLAAALAKAQAELVNPEKSQVATIRSDGSRGTEQTFRYAPLSTGLEIVRKTLGQHEIATVQTTAIDQTAGIVNLTTVLAHASGEWIASDWPVCAISETATPHRMGAALTYARRYALFTLVGIAGEDDLDAPDLNARTVLAVGGEKPASKKLGRLNSGEENSPREVLGRRSVSPKPILDPEQSAAFRDQLAAELRGIDSTDEAANWAHRVLRTKNAMTAADAACIEEAFRAKLALLATDSSDGSEMPQETERPQTQSGSVRGKKGQRATVIDKSVLAVPEPRRIRDREHVRHVTRQSCLICARRPSDAHHLRFVQNRALSRKVSDEFTVPLCRGHHREVHRSGDEAAWWNKIGIDPTVAARALWMETHPLPTISDQKRKDRPTSVVNGSDLRNAEQGRRPRRRGPNVETKPFEKTINTQ